MDKHFQILIIGGETVGIRYTAQLRFKTYIGREDVLFRNGFKNVKNFSGGMKTWLNELKS